MNWKIEQHKRGNGQQEIQVSIIVKELADCMASNFDEWNNIFVNRLKSMKRKNIFSADLFYKATPRNLYSLEVWKLDSKGDYKYKMFTVTKQ